MGLYVNRFQGPKQYHKTAFLCFKELKIVQLRNLLYTQKWMDG